MPAAGNLLLEKWDPESNDLGQVCVRIGDWDLARRGDPSLIMWTDMSERVGTGKGLSMISSMITLVLLSYGGVWEQHWGGGNLIDQYVLLNLYVCVDCPECFRPKEHVLRQYGPRWDVFSLGVVVLALVLGRRGEEAPGVPSDLERQEIRQDRELHEFLTQALQR
jgi:hypothetical protein